jgi:hypothetical protein
MCGCDSSIPFCIRKSIKEHVSCWATATGLLVFGRLCLLGPITAALGIGMANAQDFTYHDDFNDGDVTDAICPAKQLRLSVRNRTNLVATLDARQVFSFGIEQTK